jgi:hypothetical protein
MKQLALLLVLVGAWPALAADLPDNNLTPGCIDPALTKQKLCSKGFSTKSVRNTSQATKNQAYANYKIKHRRPGQYEVDHLISLEIGGCDEISNLWPQSYVTHPWNAHVKDKLENRLHKLVCDGTVTLPTAQREISSDWIKAYQKYIGAKP